ncbi:hypothetical protein CsSME_00017040 [Camellia sinensis var. sinensis]
MKEGIWWLKGNAKHFMAISVNKGMMYILNKGKELDEGTLLVDFMEMAQNVLQLLCVKSSERALCSHIGLQAHGTFQKRASSPVT